jgi:hypothetical protein
MIDPNTGQAVPEQRFIVIYRRYRVADLMALPLNQSKEKRGAAERVAVIPYLTGSIPPITVRKHSTGMMVTDGGHRLAAAVERGDEWIETKEFPCE